MKSYADCFPEFAIPSYFYGEGVIFLKGDVPVYETDDDTKEPVALIKNNDTLEIKIKGVKKALVEDSFIVYSKEKNIALLPVDIDYDDWYYVCFDQKRKLFGWVKKAENIDFATYNDLFNLYGRKNGVNIFRNVRDEFKKLYSAPDKESNVVDTFTFPKHVSLWLVSGDWILIKVTTYDDITKTGWFKWRLKDKNVIAFPDFK